jgi:hypothetical protein
MFFPGLLELLLVIALGVAYLGVVVYLLMLATRLVRAVERIANRLEQQEAPATSPHFSHAPRDSAE